MWLLPGYIIVIMKIQIHVQLSPMWFIQAHRKMVHVFHCVDSYFRADAHGEFQVCV